MKNKKLGLTLLMAGSLFLTNCTKNKTNEAPSHDYETQSTKDMVQAQIILSDIIEIAGQAHDGVGLSPYLSSTLTSVRVGTNMVTSSPVVFLPGNPNISTKTYSVNFTTTPGNDGHVRNGVLFFDYSATTSTVPSSTIKHSTPGFIASVTSTGYTVDDYSITINSMQIKNTTNLSFPAVSSYSPNNTNLTWNITADIDVAAPGGTRNLKANWNKTLLNTGNQAVPMPLTGSQTFTIFQGPAYTTVLWNYAYVSYSGTGSGSTSAGPFTYSMSNMTRNFNSSPEGYKYIRYIAPNPMAPTVVDDPERHPFLSGMMTFKEGSKPTREVDFGVANVVDYNAKVTIEGVTYDVDCK
jgi:hypothetical protein